MKTVIAIVLVLASVTAASADRCRVNQNGQLVCAQGSNSGSWTSQGWRYDYQR